MMEHGKLFVVSTPIGNLADLSPRALATLEAASVVYAEDTRRTGKLARHFGIGAPLRSLHEHNEARRVEEVVERLSAGQDCALVSDAGTPVVSDPGVRLVAAVAAAGFRVESVPGPSAVTASLAVSGLSGGRFLFLGFAPRSGRGRDLWMQEALRSPHTVVAFEAPTRLSALLREWVEGGAAERHCVVCRELTKLYEETVRGTVASLADYYSEGGVRGEVTLVLEAADVSAPPEGMDSHEAARLAETLAQQGSPTRDIARRLRREYGMTRNQAYEVALRAADRA